MDIAQLNAQTQQALWAFGAGMLVLLVITITQLAVLRRTIVRPIAALTDAADYVRVSGDYMHRMPVSSTDELARLGRSFNAMMDAIRERERELRPHLAEDNFVARVRLQEQLGYRLAYCSSPSGPVAVAGFRVVENLAWGRFLYVDDLATLATSRSRGYGAALLSWLSSLHPRRAARNCTSTPASTERMPIASTRGRK